ncbi:uncharacterized protein N7459_004857 [Penicillium hispanicum]|uniref:uncharacterized protein n=1 Tax=Penicillium hispanicum TaxID=1080232 RepID=UPI0025402D99|nr:uncharacterized protein N7459_004857 [Penicillium hispanicum]KAJ5585057.1 hypothetical protein N7459_004857 [Penicillium hispanicum]
MPALPARYGRWVLLLIPAALLLIFLHLQSSSFGIYRPLALVDGSDSSSEDDAAADTNPSPITNTTSPDTDIKHDVVDALPPCHPLPGIEDVLVILKTGITESQEKVPAHVNTTLRCIPHKLIVSDFEEDFNGIRSHDVFRNVSEALLEKDDFALYNRARAGGRQALLPHDYTKVANSAGGMMDNPGWKLDKWKFMPMIQEARSYRPDARWYFFFEADSYPVWPNLLAWLKELDSNKMLYLGSPVMLGDSVFAHGGSGFVISNPAMHAVADYHAQRVQEWEQITDEEWAGDCVLGRALKEAGVGLTGAWPHFHGWSIWELDALAEGWGSKNWCVPPLVFHHMTPADVGRAWEFDQEWFNETNTIMTFADIFQTLVYPMLVDQVEDWDNYADTEVGNLHGSGSGGAATAYDCAEACARIADCLQYRFDSHGECKTSGHAYGGVSSPGYQSGTMMWRVEALMEKRGTCRKPRWVT